MLTEEEQTQKQNDNLLIEELMGKNLGMYVHQIKIDMCKLSAEWQIRDFSGNKLIEDERLTEIRLRLQRFLNTGVWL